MPERAVAESLLALVPVAVLATPVDRLTGSDPDFMPIVFLVVPSVVAAAAAAAIGVAASYIVASIGEGVVVDLRDGRDLVREMRNMAHAIGEGVVVDLRDGLFGHLLDQGSAFYTRQRGGELLSRVVNDVATVDYMLSATLMSLARSALTLITTFGLLVVLDWRLAGRKMSGAQLRVQEQYAQLTAYLQETLGLSGMLLVRAFGRRRLEQERFAELNAELRRREIDSAMSAR